MRKFTRNDICNMAVYAPSMLIALVGLVVAIVNRATPAIWWGVIFECAAILWYLGALAVMVLFQPALTRWTGNDA